MKSNFGNIARLQHAHDSIQEIERYVSSASFESFQTNSMMQNACIRQLEIIGEACNHLTDSFIEANSTIAWREIIDLRNILIHEYFGVDIKIIWDIIKNDLPLLKNQLDVLLKDISG